VVLLLAFRLAGDVVNGSSEFLRAIVRLPAPALGLIQVFREVGFGGGDWEMAGVE
jgi:hypothetical protein